MVASFPTSSVNVNLADIGNKDVSFDGNDVRDANQLRNLVARTPVGRQVAVEVIRDKKHRQCTVEIGELPDNVLASADDSELLKQLGFSVQDLTEELAYQLGYEGQEGAIVADVEPSSEADRLGLGRGTLIRQVNRQSVHNTAEFMQALKESQQSKRVLLLAQDRRGTRFVALDLS